MHHPTYRTLKAAYSFYNVSTKTPWVELMQDALISARDVCNITITNPQLLCYYYNILLMFVNFLVQF